MTNRGTPLLQFDLKDPMQDPLEANCSADSATPLPQAQWEVGIQMYYGHADNMTTPLIPR